MIARVFDNIDLPGLENVPAELTPLYAAGIKTSSRKNLIWLTGENENVDTLKNDLESWLAFLENSDTSVHLHLLPWEDPYVNNTISPETAGEKNRLLTDITENKNIITITTLAALSIKLEKRKDSHTLTQTITINDPITPETLTKKLSNLGYHPQNKTQEPGGYSHHGHIIDLFPTGYDYPYRIKFSENKIESIKRFHPISQISIEPVHTIEITTTVYFETTKSKNTEILFLTELMKDSLIIASDYVSLQDEYKKLLANFDHMRRHHGETDADVWPPISEIFTFPIETLNVVNLTPPQDETITPMITTDPRTFIHLAEDHTTQTIPDDVKMVFCCGNPAKAEKVKTVFKTVEIIPHDIPVSLFLPRDKKHYISYLGRDSGDAGANLQASARHVFDDIQPGDFVVHKTHGIGRFAGFKHLEVTQGEEAEFLTITYKGGANLYVPVHELDILSKYVGFHGQEPTLDKIGGSSWEAKKKSAQKNVVTFARELLDSYAKRKAVPGHSFKKNSDVEQMFIRDFSFVETRDQKAAIKDVLADLEAPFPMDRLICGDVGFGKTEIALRAAVRVASAGKQVALLCPTTVLAHQHYTTFKKRFAALPYSIEHLSRKVPPPRRKEILQRLADGEIHIIIGTHALLGSGVDFKDPGLFIVDEEQRFGVFQKEKLKKGREHIDALSLSATPIPRTLSFTVAGLQDVSLVGTAPVGRKAVKNYIGRYSEELMMSAIRKETDRGGQSFIIYNNIEGIYPFRDTLQSLLPGISFELIHARMAPEEIEDTVFRFINRETDVLISTTIIENGIDIPNVNTLVIMDAHNFGLTQLYQLRGRIGRGAQQAYTYLFHGGLSEKADKRLEAIREFSQLGSGYKVAEFDLKMRGAGSLLGNKQHGHIEALGFDYFLGLLKKTISELKGEDAEIKDTDFSVQFSYSISDTYIPDTPERISVYKRVLDAATTAELLEIKEEVEDRYGELEESILRGFFAQTVKILARFFRFEAVEMSLDMLEITLRPVYDEKKEALTEFIDLVEARVTDPTGLIVEYPDYREFLETLQLYLLDMES